MIKKEGGVKFKFIITGTIAGILFIIMDALIIAESTVCDVIPNESLKEQAAKKVIFF